MVQKRYTRGTRWMTKDKQNSMAALHDTENWVVWKTKDETCTYSVKTEGFHQLLSFNNDENENNSGFKIKEW